MDPVPVPTLPGASFRLPPQLEGLRLLAYNLWWSWNPRARSLFSRIDGLAWSRYRNPIEVLAQPIAWPALLDDPAFMAECTAVLAEFEAYMAGEGKHWFDSHYGASVKGPIAYFCAEYGFHESLGIYSGGLGVLAGDHVKSASDMALPFLGVGLLYKHGYFRQTIDADGHQQHAYPDFDLTRLPIRHVVGPDGNPLTIHLELPGRQLTVAVWSVQVGRVPVLLLDTDIPENDESDRPISHILYVRGREMRLHQELVLGAGGVRAIRACWWSAPAPSWPRERLSRRPWRAFGRTPSSPSTLLSRPATSASTRTLCGAWRGRCATATASRAAAASPSTGSWSWPAAWTAILTSWT
jgi:starch phosphorylase